VRIIVVVLLLLFDSCVYFYYVPRQEGTLNNNKYKRNLIDYSYANPIDVDKMIIASNIRDSCYSRTLIELRCEEIRSNLWDLCRIRRIRDPNLEGKLIAEIVINSDGTILKTGLLYSSLHNSNFDSTIVAQIKENSFSKSYCKFDTLRILFPFVFVPAEKDTTARYGPRIKTMDNYRK
jgi:hypothetical protein